jgi:hypothetical protein
MGRGIDNSMIGRAYVSCKNFSTSIFAVKSFYNASLEYGFIVDDNVIISTNTDASICRFALFHYPFPVSSHPESLLYQDNP